MKKTPKAILCFSVALVAWVVAGVLSVQSFNRIVEATTPLATLEGPGKATFTIDEAGPLKVWHDYATFRNGVTVSHPQALPSGFAFGVSPVGSSTVLPLAASGMSETMNSGPTSKIAVGSIEIPSPGDYEITITAPPGESRIFSLSQGGVFELMGQIMMLLLIAVVLSLVGLLGMIFGIVTLVKKPKATTPLLPSRAA